jgi:DNA adenine methylase
MKIYSPLRYPGGKALLAKELEEIISKIGLSKPTYVEPYAGGAGAALSLLFTDKVKEIIINDKDPRIFAFWKSITEHPKKFAQRIKVTPVTIEEWKKQKKIYSDLEADIFDKGFATFFLNRTNRSGLLNGNPIGGINQTGSYKIDARYNKDALIERVLKIGRYKKRIEVRNNEGIELTKKYIGRSNTFIYLDPPYFVQGAMLYFSDYTALHHKELADLLNDNAKKHWLLTYDERNKIKDLYPKRHRERRPYHYRVRDSRKARELMIFSDSISAAYS